MKIPSRIRYFNKKYINRVMMVIAGKRHSPIAVIRHFGRKSGNSYTTPVIAAKNQNSFVFALTYGKEVDWYRNILARGSGDLEWHGTCYPLADPKPLNSELGCKAFTQPAGAILSLLKIENFFEMKITKEIL